jgi:hypothetical protein
MALAAVLALVPATASAGTLIAGAARDTDGFVVVGAGIVARAADGQIVGRGTTAADGTFAIDASGAAAALDVTCRYCVPQRVPLTAEPPALVVVRYAALRDRTPSADDIAALPYGRFSEIASLVPYAVTGPSGVSDRGLGAGNGATAIDGISYYRIADGRDLLNLVPTGALAGMLAQSAGFAARYGQPAQGGRFDGMTLGDDLLALHAGGAGSGGVLRSSGPIGATSFAESADATPIRRATGRFDTPFAGGSLSLVASAAGNGIDATSGAAARFTLGLTHADAFASISAGESRSALAPALGAFTGGSDVHADAHLRGRGPTVWELGVRTQSASGTGPGVAGVQGEGALYADLQHDGPQTTIAAAVALQSDVESAGPGRWHTTSLLPSFAFEERLGGGFAVNASTTAAIRDPYLEQFGGYASGAPIPPYFMRTNVLDAGLSYSDGRRLRVDGIAYAQRAGDRPDYVDGIGLNAAWQVTPHLALRTWALAGFTGTDIDLPPAVTYAYSATSAPLRREVVWLTYRNGLRFDLLDRGAGIDGSLDVPLGHGFTLVAGTFGRMPGRVITIELRAQPR